MNPLIKWPGGKANEIKQIEHLIPDFERYIEPFFGGGALFFHLQPKKAAINDISKSLMNFYSLLKSQDEKLNYYLNCYNQSLCNLIAVCQSNYSELHDIYVSFRADELKLNELATQFVLWFDNKSSSMLTDELRHLILDECEFLEHVSNSAIDKIKRTVENDRKSSFSEEDLKNNLITGFTSGYYMYFRKVYNDIGLKRIESPSPQYEAANFYFIREYCYGSMFRYNKAGEFNIPYGGMSYNKKNLKSKIDNMFNNDVLETFQSTDIYCSDFEDFFKSINLTDKDFMFLDPPYDTDFSDYEGNEFTKADQERLAKALRKTSAKFILVIKNTDFIYSLYKDYFNILSFDNQYTYNVRSRNERNVEHLIITNLPVD